MKYTGVPFLSNTVCTGFFERLLAVVLLILFTLAATVFGTMLLAGLLVAGLLFAVQAWWLGRHTPRPAAGRTIRLDASDYRILSASTAPRRPEDRT